MSHATKKAPKAGRAFARVGSGGLVGLRPADCKTIGDILSINCSHKIVGRYSLLIQHDGAAIFMEQTPGQPATASITIPRSHFKQLLEWYQTEQPNTADDLRPHLPDDQITKTAKGGR